MQAVCLLSGRIYSNAKSTVSLSLYWLFGLLTGIYISWCQDSLSISLMHGVLSAPVSIMSLALSVYLPFLFTVLSLCTHRYYLFQFTCFIKAVAYGFCTMSMIRLFRFSAWIPCILLLFTDVLYLIYLFWFWLRHNGRAAEHVRLDCLLGIIVGALLIAVDYFVFVPILQRIF